MRATMHHAELTEFVRRRIALVFAELGDSSAGDLRESILIRDGSYCGRRFEANCGHAIWFVEENELKLYDQSGAIIRVLEPDAAQVRPLRMAA